MKHLALVLIIFLGVFAFFFYEDNFDTQNICSTYANMDKRERVSKNPIKALNYTKKWNDACTAQINRYKQVNNDFQQEESCRDINRVSSSTLAYVSLVKKYSDDKASAIEALNNALDGIYPYTNCVQYEAYNKILNQSLLKIKKEL